MSVLRGLAREHAAFARLISRLEESAGGDPKSARRNVRNSLLILLSALDRHEKVEDIVFGNPTYAGREDARLILEQVEFQHGLIQDLRAEFLDTITASEAVPIPRLKFLATRLAECLRAHFRTEEESLWPHYESVSRSLGAATRRRLERDVRALESEISANSASLADYLEATSRGSFTA